MKKFPRNYCLTIFADASHCPNTNAAGIAFWARNNDRSIYESVGVEHADGSAQAELQAIFEAVKHCDKEGLLNKENLRVVVIRSDCVQALEAIKHNGKLGKSPHANSIRSFLSSVRIKLTHIKGHNGTETKQNRLNDWCDKAAKKQMRRVRNSLPKMVAV